MHAYSQLIIERKTYKYMSIRFINLSSKKLQTRRYKICEHELEIKKIL